VSDGMDRAGGRLVVAAAVLGLGVALAGVAIGGFLFASRSRAETVQVVGSASQAFRSDVAKWRVVLARRTPEDGLSRGYGEIGRDLERFRTALAAEGVDSSAISVQPVNAQPLWGPQGMREGYNLVQSLYVVSQDPAALERLALNPGELLSGGAVLESSQLEYYYSGIGDLKRSLLAAATEDARRRASEIAGAAEGGSLGRMVSGRAGVFQITEPYSTDVASYGIHSTATKDKEISVTVHAVFRLD
jgi:uncharacterized protein